MIVACMAGVVAVALDAVRQERRDSGGGWRSNDVDFFIGGAKRLANPMARTLGGEIFRGGDGHSHGYTAAHVWHEVLVPLAE